MFGTEALVIIQLLMQNITYYANLNGYVCVIPWGGSSRNPIVVKYTRTCETRYLLALLHIQLRSAALGVWNIHECLCSALKPHRNLNICLLVNWKLRIHLFSMDMVALPPCP